MKILIMTENAGLDERKELIDAARESARTFDKAVLTFGAGMFAFSMVFLKDIAPRPAPPTLKWLGAAWALFALGLLLILLSFLFSHRACLFEIENLEPGCPTRKNPWSRITNWCNVLCVVSLVLGLSCWSVFAFDNLGQGRTAIDRIEESIDRKGYVPPPPDVGGSGAAQPEHRTPQSPKK
jgi:hypothetical protein